MEFKNTNVSRAKEDFSDRRRAPRHNVHFRVRIVPQQKGASYCFGQASDIGEFGMSLFVATELEIGAVVDIEFGLPYNHETILLRATVRNRQGFRYGLEFLYPTMQQRQAINKTCRALMILR